MGAGKAASEIHSLFEMLVYVANFSLLIISLLGLVGAVISIP
jgi:hypothetical protein